MDVQAIKEAIKELIPNHGMIVLNHSIHSNGDTDNNFYSAAVHEKTTNKDSQFLVKMAGVIQCYQPGDIMPKLIESFAQYKPNKAEQIERLRKVLAELEA